MDRTSLGDFQKLRLLLIAQRPVELDAQLDPIDLPFLGFAFGAIFGVYITYRTGGNLSSTGSV